MPSSSSERVTCPTCGKGYRWQANLVGRKVTCKACGGEFEVPSAPGEGIAIEPEPVADDGTYELDLDADEPQAAQASHAAPSNNGKCPVCNTPVRDGAVICMNCGFNMAEGKRMETAVADTPATETSEEPEQGKITRQMQRDMQTVAETHRQHVWQEYKLPIILLCVGFAFVLINTFGLVPAVNEMLNSKGAAWIPITNGQAMAGYLIAFVLTLVLMIPLLFGGIFLMAALFGSAFGNLFTAALKMLALTVFVVGLDDLIDLLLDLATGGFGGIGYFVRLMVVLTAFYPICTKLFDMESHEVWIMFLIYVIGPIAIGILAMMIAMSFF